MSGTVRALLPRLIASHELTEVEARDAFRSIMSGDETPEAIASFLTSLRMRGETVTEIAAAARFLRENAIKVIAPVDAIDMCGTGGDGAHTLNISTAATFVVASQGVPVAKHGNRAQSSKCGAADVLAALGVRLDLTPESLEICLRSVGTCFLFAQTHHPAMHHVAPVRAALGFRTIFNLLGPLSSPASVRRQVVGVFDAKWIMPMAEALCVLGAERALVMHGAGGLDEVSTTGETTGAILEAGTIRPWRISPEEAGLPRAELSALRGGDAATNARALRGALAGEKGAYRDIVCLNAAAGLWVAGRVTSIREGVELAREAIDAGSAARTLEALIACTQKLGSAPP